jgi:hypothetical protein
MSSFVIRRPIKTRRTSNLPLVEGLEGRRLLAAGDFGAITSIGGSGEDHANHVVVDPFGSIVVVGQFSGTSVDFDPGTDTKVFDSNGDTDVFVAKYSSRGALVWAVRAGGVKTDNPSSVVLDGAGNVYVGGAFEDVVDFRPGRKQALLSARNQDGFIWKLNQDGKFVWAMRMGGRGQDEVNSLAVDGAGNVHAAGFFQNAAVFGKSTTVTGKTGRNAFVVKFSPNAVLAFAKSFGSVETEAGTGLPAAVDARGVAVDPQGNIYVGGVFNHTADFDPGSGTTNLTTTADSGGKHGQNDAFVLKLNSSGALTWARQLGGAAAEDLTGIALDRSQNVLTTGSYTGTADFDPGGANSDLTAAGSNDIFVSKLSSAGNFVWAESMGGSGVDTGLAIVADKLGNVFTTGNFNTSGDFDPGAGTTTLSSGSNLNHAFVSKLNPDGSFGFAAGFFASTGGQALGSGIALAPSSRLWTVGSFAGTVDFDPGTATQSKSSSSSSVDAFMSRLER